MSWMLFPSRLGPGAARVACRQALCFASLKLSHRPYSPGGEPAACKGLRLCRQVSTRGQNLPIRSHRKASLFLRCQSGNGFAVPLARLAQAAWMPCKEGERRCEGNCKARQKATATHEGRVELGLSQAGAIAQAATRLAVFFEKGGGTDEIARFEGFVKTAVACKAHKVGDLGG